MKKKTIATTTTCQTQMKMSFSDNFVCDNLPKANTNNEPTNTTSAATALPTDEMSNTSNQPSSPGPLSSTSKEVGFAFPSQEGSGFDDDFTPYSINSRICKIVSSIVCPSTCKSVILVYFGYCVRIV